MQPGTPAASAPGDPGTSGTRAAAGDVTLVEEIVRTLDKAIRVHQLYEGASPSYERFLGILRDAFRAFWKTAEPLVVTVQENRLLWEGQRVYEGQQRPGDLAFLFFRDGIRELAFHPGFEDRGLPAFLDLIARIQGARDDQDDLITLFWEHDLEGFTYRNVDVAVDGLDAFSRSPGRPPAVDPEQLRAEMAAPPSYGAGTPPPPTEVNTPEFREALYLLDPSEFKALREELDRELQRDLMRDVLHGLLDRLEDGALERQQRIVRILADMLPGLLSSGRFSDAEMVLADLRELAGRGPPPALATEIDALFARLADAETVGEMVRTIEDSPGTVRVEECAALLRHFPVAALEPLIQAAGTAERPEVRRALSDVAERLAAGDLERILSLLGSPVPEVAAGAARLVGRMGTGAGAPGLARLLQRTEPEVRIAAVVALQSLRVSSAAGALAGVLEDPERDVRIAAARALGELRYTPARARMEELIQSKRIRDADITERLAFFEAYGAVAGAEGVALLGRLLNGRSWLGRREPPEIRASAALALGRIGTRPAREALESAGDDPEMVVRTAVARALRGEGS
jgi:hypothetical protein